MLRRLIVGGLAMALAVSPASAPAAGSWTERIAGDATPGLPLGESFSLTPDGLGLFAVATWSVPPAPPVTLRVTTS